MNYQVLFQTCPMWKPGERDVDAAARRGKQEDAETKDRFPNDYGGRVIAVIPDQKDFSPADLSNPCRRVVSMDLSEEELTALRTRTHKIGPGLRIEKATFEDRWGAVAKTLRDSLADPEAAERGDEETDLEARRFAELSALAKQMLPKVEVHTGAGLYEVGPGKTYSTIQSALDQLWTDQGSAAFTASQVVRVFASTYDENVTPNAALDPDEANGFQLVIEGDPADDRDNIIIQPTSGTEGIYANCDSAIVRHLTITSSVAIYGVWAYSGNIWIEVTDCNVSLTTSSASIGIYPRGRAYIADCDVSIQSQGSSAMGIYSYSSTMIVRRCKVTGNGGDATGITGRMGHVAESCVVSGFFVGFGDYPSGPGIGPNQIRNCVVYNCTNGIYHWNYYHVTLDVVNTIFHTCTNVLTIKTAMPEWSGSDVIGDVARFLNCCFFTYTTFAKQDGGAGDKTYAEFIALNRVEAEGNLDVTDPLFTDPGAGDFSLQTGSPCIKTGHGVGLVLDYLGLAFDPNNPDIGSWSSGSFDIPNAPTITAMVNDGNGTSATASVLTDTGSKVFILSRERNSAEAWTVRGSRTDSGDIVATGFTNNTNYESIAIATFGTLVTEKPSLPSIPVGVFVTDASGFFAAIMQALYDWATGELGIAAIWYRPNAAQPARPYATLNMGVTQSPRWDYHSPPDEVNGVSTLRGDREFGLEIQIHHEPMPGGQNPAYSLAEQLATSLQKGSIVALFSAANFAFVNRVALTDISAIGGTEFEARASLDLLFRMAHEDTDTVGVIETVDPVDATFE